MFLKDVLAQELDRWAIAEVKGISRDSRTAQEGDIFFCFAQDKERAEKQCQEASSRGAKFVVSQFDVPINGSIKAKDVRDLFARSCANFYGRACDDMKMVAITGTNGKTTTSHLIAEIMNRNGHKTGVIGTNGVFYGGKKFDCPLTTPDADFLHKTFREMRDDGVECVVMEVSAHAIDQKRTNGIIFDVGVLTNITQDHLDYFKTFDRYSKTKLDFFSKEHIRQGIVCGDDKLARSVAGRCDVPIKTYGITLPCDIFAIDTLCTLDGSRFVANLCDDAVLNIKTNLIGQYNVYNSLAALGVCQALGLEKKELENGLNFVMPVEGRFNVSKIDGKYVVIDFAHTPDGLEKVLKTARELTDKKVWVVFGCGGNRDSDKRPKMGKIAEDNADVVCLTDDNPRMENSQDIIGDIEAGMRKDHFVQPDREKAIRKIVGRAEEGDIVVIAGKGAEKYQEIGTQKVPYNDFDVVADIENKSRLKKLGGKDFAD